MEGSVAVGSTVVAEVDHARRRALRANHSATHLLHEALRQVWDRSSSEGSLVGRGSAALRFQPRQAITAEELAEVEDIANRVVLQNEPVTTAPHGDRRRARRGARALFGEKYGDGGRVVSMGRGEGGRGATPAIYSIELCGGTHAARTGDIGSFDLGESAVGSGVRRIEARTGHAARRGLNADASKLRDLAQLLKASPILAGRAADGARRGPAAARARIDRRAQEIALGGAGWRPDGCGARGRGVKLMARVVTGIDMRDLKGLADEAKTTLGSGIVAVGGGRPGR